MNEFEEAYKGKTVLVTGGAGCIGGNLVRTLVRLKAKRVIILDNYSSSYAWNVLQDDAVTMIEGDIRDKKILAEAFAHKPDKVFHLAAHFANQNSVEHPELDLDVNGMGILRTLQFAQESGVDRFVYTSSGCGVYGKEQPMPFKEENISIRLHTPYQVTKLIGELYTNYFHNLFDVPIVNARLFNVFGPGEVPGRYRNVIPNFMYWSMLGKPLPITGDGTETRDWTFVTDAVSGLLAMGSREEAIGEAFNVGSAKDVRVVDMAEMVNKLTGNEAGIKFIERRNWDVKTKLLSSIDKAKERLDYGPQTRFEDGVEQVHRWFSDNWKQIEDCAEF